jgi:SAM-dependent methyltransferase
VAAIGVDVKTLQDAFGHALMDFYRGIGGWAVVERDDGYIDSSEGIDIYFAGYKMWPTHQRRAIELAKGRVLDIGCGAGRHALYLQAKGLDVTGIDESPLAIRVCRERGLQRARVASITRIPSNLGVFDTILMLGNNFGLFGSQRRARWLLRRLRGLTSDNGRILAESHNPFATKNAFHRRYQKSNVSRGRMRGQVRIRLRYQSYVTKWFDYLLVSRKEMQGITRGTGWKITRHIESGGPLYIAVLEKA